MEYYGFYKAIVSNLNDPEKRGRIKCLIPDILGDSEESAWCEPCSAVAYDGGGDFCLPKIKETVWITFEEGDPNYPIYLGGWWQTGKTPLSNYATMKDNTRIISYEDTTILMKEGSILLNVASGSTEITIKEGKVSISGDVSIKGDTTITGDVNVTGSIKASGSVKGSNIN